MDAANERWTLTERLELWTGRAIVWAGRRLRPILTRVARTPSGELLLGSAGVDVDRLHRMDRYRESRS